MPFLAQKAYMGLPTSARKPTRASRKVCGRKTERNGEKTKQDTRSRETPLPPRVREKGLREVPRESKNSRGPEWHPDKTPEGKDARPKRENKPVAAGTQKEKEKKRKCVWGCDLLLPELFLLKKKRKQTHKRTTTSAKKNQRRREKNPKNTRPDINRIFPRQFRERKNE